MTNPIPAWWPEKKEIYDPLKGASYATRASGFNEAFDLCLTAFSENIPTEKQWEKILTQSMFHDGTYLSDKHAEELSVCINTRLMEGK